ncbi:MAG: hypothetical protein ACEPOW_04725 [Bacteroidales bacterium]
MKKQISYILLVFTTIISLNKVNGQNVDIKSYTDTNEIVIGGQTDLHLEVTAPADKTIIWPILKDTLNKQIEIISKSNIDTIKSGQDNLYTLRQNLKITSFTDGEHNIPELKFGIKEANDSTIYYALSNPAFIRTTSIQVDTTKQFKPIVGYIKQGITVQMIVPYVLLGILIIAIIIATIIYIRRRKNQKPIFTPKPKEIIPADKLAIKLLEELRLKKLWQQEMFKEYYSELTEIIRDYIENRFEVQALEQTTEEIIGNLQGHKINDQAMEKLSFTLKKADLVKFAKLKPTALENDRCLEDLLDFVRETPIIKIEEDVKKEINDENIKEEK